MTILDTIINCNTCGKEMRWKEDEMYVMSKTDPKDPERVDFERLNIHVCGNCWPNVKSYVNGEKEAIEEIPCPVCHPLKKEYPTMKQLIKESKKVQHSAVDIVTPEVLKRAVLAAANQHGHRDPKSGIWIPRRKK